MNTMADARLRVLFLCTENAARSQMAERLLRQMSRDRIDVWSAGTEPAPQIHPMARAAIGRMLRLEMSGQAPKSLQQFIGQRFDYIITVCDRAMEACPVMPGDPERIHWRFTDPMTVPGPPEVQQRAFDRVATEIAARIRIWMALPGVRSRL